MVASSSHEFVRPKYPLCEATEGYKMSLARGGNPPV